MPWNPNQHRLFCACMGNTPKAKALRKKTGISQAEAKKMCHEGIARTMKKKK